MNQFQQWTGHPESDDDENHGQNNQRALAPRSERHHIAFARSQDHAAHMQQSAGKHTGSKQNKQNRRQNVATIERRTHDEELALKQTEWRHANDGQHGHEEHHTSERHGLDHAAFEFGKQIGFEILIDVTRAQKQQRFGDGMKRHMEHESQAAHDTADAQSGYHDAGMVDGVIREQAAIIFLNQDKGHRNAHRKYAEQQQQTARELGAQTAAGKNVEAD